MKLANHSYSSKEWNDCGLDSTEGGSEYKNQLTTIEYSSITVERQGNQL